MKPIAIFYHGLFFKEDQAIPHALPIIQEQMGMVKSSGLLDAATEFHVGINGGDESHAVARIVFPPKAMIRFHGLQCHNENRTILMLENWLPTHPDWHVLYFHAKGVTHPPGHFSEIWRKCMMKHCVRNWWICVADLENGYDTVGCHWMEPPATPEGQYIFAGTFWWATSNYLLTLPSIMDRDRIKESGIDAAESRYEAEVWLGMAPKKPRIKDYHGPDWNPSKLGTCTA